MTPNVRSATQLTRRRLQAEIIAGKRVGEPSIAMRARIAPVFQHATRESASAALEIGLMFANRSNSSLFTHADKKRSLPTTD